MDLVGAIVTYACPLLKYDCTGVRGQIMYGQGFSNWTYKFRIVKGEPEQESGEMKTSESPSRKELIEELLRLDSALDRIPYPSDVSEMTNYSAAKFQNEFGSWDEALDVAGIDKEEELLTELQRVTDELGKKPTQSEVNSLGKYSHSMYARYFGQWSIAKERLDDFEASETVASQQSKGVENASQSESKFVWNTPVEQSVDNEQQEPTQTNAGEYTTEELLKYIRELDKLFGEPPSEQFVRHYGSYPIEAYKTRFTSWNGVIDAATLPSVDWEKRSNRKFTRVEILDKLVEYAAKAGEVPEPIDVWKNTDLYAMTVENRFGGLATAFDLAGITDDAFEKRTDQPDNADVDVSPDDSGVIHELNRIGEPPSDPPSPSDFERKSMLSVVTVRESFGTWLNALQKAGYNPEDAIDDEESAQGYTKEELIEEIRRVTIRTGAVPASRDFDNIADMTSQTVKNHIGGWEIALERAGVSNLDNSEIRNLWDEYKLPDAETLQAEVEWVDEAVAGRTTNADIRTFARYPESYFEEVFGSVDNALELME